MKVNNKQSRKGLLPVITSLLIGIISVIAFGVIYSLTKYLLMMLLALVIALPMLINLFLLIFSKKQSKENGFDESDYEFIEEDENTSKKMFSKLKRFGKNISKRLSSFFTSWNAALRIAFSVLAILAVQVVFWSVTKRVTSVYKINYLYPVILLIVFVIFIIFEKWCKHTETDSTYLEALLRNIRTSFAVARFAIVCVAAALAVKLIASYDAQKWIVYVFWAVFIYETVFIVISLSVKLIRREIDDDPDASIPKPFSKGYKNDLGILSYLEKNTGITMRSLWSMKLIKNLIPYTVVIALSLFWICTGIVQIESEQLGALYRFGRLQNEPLQPGLHFVLPWPFDSVNIYNTETINKITVGYSSTENTDNTWTGNHGSNEYKLVLGGGNELVSVNIRLEYKINDLMQYLKSSNAPEKLIEAKAYEAITYRIVNTDLDSLLSIDRSEFSKSFHAELSNAILPYNTGLEIVSVVLESIHPPLEIGDVYQKLVGAEIDAEKARLDAEAQAAVIKAEAEKSYNTVVIQANADKLTKVANAKASVAEFMASVEADGLYSDSYRYNKYLNAICKAYKNAKLVIVGEGIDSSNIYFGSFKLAE